METTRKHFESLADMAEFAKRPCEVSANNETKRWLLTDRFIPQDSWLGMDAEMEDAKMKSFDDYIDFTRRGWASGANQITSALDMLDTPLPQSVRRRVRWGDDGDDVCIDRIRTGNIDNAWRRSLRAIGCGPQAVKIAIQINGIASVDARDLFWRGAAACVMADALQMAGYRVEIEAHAFARLKSGHHTHTSFTVKSFEQLTTTADLAATLASASTFRFVELSARLVLSPVRNDSCGKTVPMKADQVAVPANTTLLLQPAGSVSSLETARRWITESVAKIADAHEQMALAA